MIHETPEGFRYRIGINYWFPKDHRTLWRIVFCIPLFIWYRRGEGWMLKRFSFRIRRRNPSRFPEGYGPMLFTSKSLYSTQLLS